MDISEKTTVETEQTVEQTEPMTAEQPAEPTEKRRSPRKKGRPSKARMALTFCVGLAFLTVCGFALWGAGSGIVGLFRADGIYTEGVDTASIVAATAMHEELAAVEADSEEYFEILLRNFIKLDVPPFAGPNELDSEYVVAYGLWQTIELNNSQGVLAGGEDGAGYRVPKKLVEKMATYSLEYTDKIEHHTVDLCGKFEYNKLNGTYKVPVSHPVDYLVPNVVSVELSEEQHTAKVTVDCYQYSDVDPDPTENESNFRKRVVVTLTKVGNSSAAESAVEPVRYTLTAMHQEEKVADPAADEE